MAEGPRHGQGGLELTQAAANWLRPPVGWIRMTSNAHERAAFQVGSPQERGSAAWFDGQYCSLEASIVSLI